MLPIGTKRLASALLLSLLAGCAAPPAWQPARPLDTSRTGSNDPPLLVTGYRVPSATVSLRINFGVEDGWLAERAELRLEANTNGPHRLTLETSSSARRGLPQSPPPR